MIDLFRPFMAQPAVNEAVARVLSYRPDGRLYCGEGPLVKEFEREFAALVGADPATVVAVNSCSSALALALQLCGVEGPGVQIGFDYEPWEVISTSQTCTATNEAIVNAGARIVWADVLPESGLLDPADVARKITPRTKAIMAVDWGGHACDYEGLRESAFLNSEPGQFIPIIEDAAHALLTRYRDISIGDVFDWGKPAGGDYVCYSLGPIKHLTAGDGGILITQTGDPERGKPSDAARARLLRWHGLDRESSADFRCSQTIAEPGHKWHMTDLNAAIGLANIGQAEWIMAKHRQNAAFYDRALTGAPGVVTPPPDEHSSYWCYFLLVEDRADFQSFMAERGIATSPVHARNDTHPAYHFPNGPLPGVDHYAARNVAIPVGWWVTEEERHHIAGSVLEWAYGRERRAA